MLFRSELDTRCSKLFSDLDGYDIHINVYKGVYDSKDICEFEVECIADSYRECESLYKVFKDYVKKLSHKRPTQLMKLRGEKF